MKDFKQKMALSDLHLKIYIYLYVIKMEVAGTGKNQSQ